MYFGCSHQHRLSKDMESRHWITTCSSHLNSCVVRCKTRCGAKIGAGRAQLRCRKKGLGLDEFQRIILAKTAQKMASWHVRTGKDARSFDLESHSS